MKYDLYTVSKNDIEKFKDELPDFVIDNCDKKGFFMIGATDSEATLIGIAQFYIGLMPDGECMSDIIYVYVDEDYRHLGAASRMISKIHNILKKSSVDKSIAVMDKKLEEKKLFVENGYLFMKVEKDAIEYLEKAYGEFKPAKMEQGLYRTDI